MLVKQQLAEKEEISTHQTPIVRGKFPSKTAVYHKPSIIKLNSILASSLVAVILVSMLSHLGVVAKENKIKDLHSHTNKLNYENIELQNRVDYLKSFYTIDDKIQNIDFLKKADKVMEVKKKNNVPVLSDRKDFFDVTSVHGY